MPSDTESVTHHSVQSDPDPDNAKHKAQHRARMRRHRARRGKGMECLVIRVTGSELDRFQAAGYLDRADRADRGDRAAEARAIECFITDYLP